MRSEISSIRYINHISSHKKFSEEQSAVFRKTFLPKQGVPRSFWSHEKDSDSLPNSYGKFDESMIFLVDYIELHGPFDGIIGFSQG
jgi:hypothetical protein